jgi:hypothetical protein
VVDAREEQQCVRSLHGQLQRPTGRLEATTDVVDQDGGTGEGGPEGQ